MEAQGAPPMMEKQMITITVDTLPVFYYEKMVGYAPSSCVDFQDKLMIIKKNGKCQFKKETRTKVML